MRAHYKRWLMGIVLFCYFMLTANFSTRDSQARAEIREAYLFAVSGPILAMIVGIIVTGALTEHDPKSQEIKPTPSTSSEKDFLMACSVAKTCSNINFHTTEK